MFAMGSTTHQQLNLHVRFDEWGVETVEPVRDRQNEGAETDPSAHPPLRHTPTRPPPTIIDLKPRPLAAERRCTTQSARRDRHRGSPARWRTWILPATGMG